MPNEWKWGYLCRFVQNECEVKLTVNIRWACSSLLLSPTGFIKPCATRKKNLQDHSSENLQVMSQGICTFCFHTVCGRIIQERIIQEKFPAFWPTVQLVQCFLNINHINSSDYGSALTQLFFLAVATQLLQPPNGDFMICQEWLMVICSNYTHHPEL